MKSLPDLIKLLGSEKNTNLQEQYLIEICEKYNSHFDRNLKQYSSQLINIASTQSSLLYAKFWNAVSLTYSGDLADAENELLNLIKETLNYPELQVKIYNSLSWNCISKGEFEKSLRYAQNAFEIATINQNKNGLAQSHNYIGISYSRLCNYEKGLSHQLEAYKLYEETGGNTAPSLINIGNIYLNQGNYPEALKYYLECLEVRKKHNQRSQMASVLGNIAIVYEVQNDFEVALDYHHQSLALNKEFGNIGGIATSLGNIGLIYKLKGDIHKAENHFLRSLELRQKTGNQFGIIDSLLLLAEIYLDKNKIEKAETLVQELTEKLSHIQTKVLEIRVLVIKGKLEKVKGNFKTALDYYQKALEMALETGREYDEKDVYKLLSDVYKGINDFENAYKTYILYNEKEKKILGEKNYRYIASVKYAAELEQKRIEAEIEQLKNVELKQAYEDLKTTQDELIKKERMAAIGKIASEIAHEVQNPLNFVNNFSELNSDLLIELAEEIKLNGMSKTATDLINDLNINSSSINLNGKRAAGIVSKLLEITRKGVNK
jgi:two-component system, NtrC family, sensor kinase